MTSTAKITHPPKDTDILRVPIAPVHLSSLDTPD